MKQSTEEIQKEMYACSTSFDKLLAQFNEKEIRAAFEMLIHYKSEYIKAKIEGYSPVDRAHSFQQLIDEEVKILLEKKDANKISCRKGCSFCCRIVVDITQDEAVLLTERAKEIYLKIDTEKLKRQAQKATIEKWRELSFEDRKCVFLSENGECNVYEYRPMGCRKYNVVTEPDLCDWNKHKAKNNIGVASNIFIEGIYSGAINAVKTGAMPELLLEALKHYE